MQKMYSNYELYVLTNMPAATFPMLKKWSDCQEQNKAFRQHNPSIIGKAFKKETSKK